MPTLETAARNAAVNAVTALIDNSGPGDIRFETGASAEVATLTFAATAFTGATAGVDTADTIVSDSDAAGGTIDHALLRDGAGATIVTATVGVGTGDIQMSSLVIGVADTVSISSMTMTMPAS